MARDFARILTSVWRDPDWRTLPHTAQWLYLQLISRPDINAAGVLTVNISRWSRGSDDLTEDDIRTAFKILVHRRYVVVDDFEDEMLIRSFIRNDGIVKQPKVMIGACRQAMNAESAQVRRALAAELERVRLDVSDMARKEVQRAIDELTSDDPEPPDGDDEEADDEAIHGSYGNPIHDGADTLSKKSNGGARKPNRLPSGEVTVVGVGGSVALPPTQDEAPSELALVDRRDVEPAPPPLPDPTKASVTKRSQALATAYYEQVPLCSFVAVMKLAKHAIGTGLYSDEQIRAGLLKLADEGWTVTANTLRQAIEGRPKSKPDTDDNVAGALSFLRPEDEQHHQRGNAS